MSSYGIRLKVSGDYGCFTRPEMKVERVSYDVMTPSAARGILEAIHWKPAIRWFIDAVHVLEPIRFQNIRRNEVSEKAPYTKLRSAMQKGDLGGLGQIVEDDRQRQQRAAMVLVRPAYVIEAHFELTDRAGPGDYIGKHLDIFNRRAAKGQCFHQPCLGTREFTANFELIGHDKQMPSAINVSRDLGFMLYDIDHDKNGARPMFFRAQMVDGIVKVPAPSSPEVIR
jgi:CRISPR-associated protein Cas5, subtype I-C/DVULG